MSLQTQALKQTHQAFASRTRREQHAVEPSISHLAESNMRWNQMKEEKDETAKSESETQKVNYKGASV